MKEEIYCQNIGANTPFKSMRFMDFISSIGFAWIIFGKLAHYQHKIE